MNKIPRVRFAPAPTGMMHLGNVRTALMNFIFSKKENGTFILRIEDTDTERNYDPNAEKIQEDLSWLHLMHDEGPGKDGDYGPYFQSQRAHFYQEKLEELIKMNLVYRCFCTTEELEKKRLRQIALKKPPRYDQVCRTISQQESDEKSEIVPFIWRMHLDETKTVVFSDFARKTVTFDLKNFSDFPLTRQDGTFTFIFANFVDDMMMKITHILRGEDHLSNTALQVALYHAFQIPLPTFWHMPILCGVNGQKLSKRDFGFSLRDLKDAGFLPEAIVNYLATIGGSFEQEIMSLEEMIKMVNFDHISTAGQIKYDIEKLRWMNHAWICKQSSTRLTQLCRPYLEQSYDSVKNMSEQELEHLIKQIQQELVILPDAVSKLAFYFTDPVYEYDISQTLISIEKRDLFIKIMKNNIPISETFLESIKKEFVHADISTKMAFSWIRFALTGAITGLGVSELIQILGNEKSTKRILNLLEQVNQ